MESLVPYRFEWVAETWIRELTGVRIAFSADRMLHFEA